MFDNHVCSYSVHNSENGDDYIEDPDPVTLISKLDISDPLHLHPNDTTALTVVSIKLKGTENYQVWSNTDEVLGRQWDRVNAIVLGWILNSISEELLLDDSYMQIRGSILSREVFHDVRSAYATISSEESYRVAAGSIVDEQMATLISLIKDNKIGKNMQANMSGTNQHMTYTDKELDNVLDISHLKIKVGHPNGTEAFISKIGNLKLSNGLVLYDVMVIPEYCITLIFVHKLAKEIKIPNDDERVDHNLNSDQRSQSDSINSSEFGSGVNTTDFTVNNFRNDVDSSDDILLLIMRRSSRQSVFPKNYNDFVVESKVKYGLEKSSGEIDRYKARLVAQGFGQKEGIDYEETFSLVVKMVTVRCLWNIVVSMAWPVFQLDVNNAFLYGDLEEVVYMKPPEGYFPSGNKVCRLKKSLYGLEQAPRQWNAILTSTLIENGFSQSKSDYSLYTKSDKGVFLAFLVYVDDIIITGNSVSEIEKFKGICLNQRKYVLDLLSEYGMLACKPATTPLMSKLIISNEASEKEPILDNITDYQKLMGKLCYLTNTRPDITYVVHCLSQFMHSPLNSHLKISFKILRYLKSCPGLGIHIIRTSGVVKTVKVESVNQIAYILTKGLDIVQHKELVEKLVLALEKALGPSLKVV
ncbi:ribonuclease H-like domain-containing protein [Tanacetum coccineum]